MSKLPYMNQQMLNYTSEGMGYGPDSILVHGSYLINLG